jgi:hypothetical protein
MIRRRVKKLPPATPSTSTTAAASACPSAVETDHADGEVGTEGATDGDEAEAAQVADVQRCRQPDGNDDDLADQLTTQQQGEKGDHAGVSSSPSFVEDNETLFVSTPFDFPSGEVYIACDSNVWEPYLVSQRSSAIHEIGPTLPTDDPGIFVATPAIWTVLAAGLAGLAMMLGRPELGSVRPVCRCPTETVRPSSSALRTPPPASAGSSLVRTYRRY